jgi:hypothetical protein
MDLRELFKIWRDNAMFARYDRWCEEYADDLIRETTEKPYTEWSFYIPFEQK